MEITKNPITAQIEQDEAVKAGNEAIRDEPQDLTPEQVERVQKLMKLFKKAREGKLNFRDYKSLPKNMQRIYKGQFGVPKTATALVGVAKRIQKRRAAAKTAKASRRRNRVS